MKRTITILLVLCFCLALGTAALAAEDDGYSIYLAEPVEGESYNVYKIFDVTYNEDGTDGAFTIDASSPWFSMVMDGYTVYDEIDSMGFSSLPFTLTQQGSTDTYEVTVETGTSSDDILAYFPNAEIPAEAEIVASGVCDSADMRFNVPEEGFYYVTTADGAPVCLAAIMSDVIAGDLVTTLVSGASEEISEIASMATDSLTSILSGASGEIASIIAEASQEMSDASSMMDYNMLLDGNALYLSLMTSILPSGDDIQVLVVVVGDDEGSIYDLGIFDMDINIRALY